MKLTREIVPLTVTLLSGLACTPSSNRGPTPSTADSASESARSESTAENGSEAVDSPDQGHALDAPTHSLDARQPGAPLRARPIVVPRPSGPYRVRIVDAAMHDLPLFHHDGRAYVLGAVGQRYEVVLSNPTRERVEAVISIDGLDAIDGTSADYVHKRGYILPAYGSATIEGFRTSLDAVATFRFSSVADSYAGRLGQARDVGVIGVAFFPERAAEVVAVPPPAPPNEWQGSGGGSARASNDGPRDSAHKRESSPASRAAPPSASPAARSAAPKTASGAGDALGAAEARESTNGSPLRSEHQVEERRGLGTEFGESRESRVVETEFVRANQGAPSQVAVFRYNDRPGLLALGIRIDPPLPSDPELTTRETADPFRANRFASPPPY